MAWRRWVGLGLSVCGCAVGVEGQDYGWATGASGVGEASDGSSGEASTAADESSSDAWGGEGSTTGAESEGSEGESTGVPTCDGVDLGIDAEHCGACNHSCLGGACEAGACRSLVLAQGFESPNHLAVIDAWAFVAADGGLFRVPTSGGAVELVAGGRSHWIASDGATLYWANEDAGAILSTPVEGGVVSEVASDLTTPWAVVVDEDAVYFNARGIGRVSKAGGVAVPLADEGADGIISDLLAVGTDRLYWPTGTGSLMAIPKGGGADTVVATGSQVCSVAAGGGHVFAMVSASGCQQLSTLVRIPEGGGPPEPLLEAQPWVYPMTVHGDHVYWRTFANGSSDLLRMSVDGGPATVLVSEPGLTIGLAPTDDALYWTNNDAGTVAKVAL